MRVFGCSVRSGRLEMRVELSSQHAVPPSVDELLCGGVLYAMGEVGE